MQAIHSRSTSQDTSAQNRDSDYKLLTTKQGNINRQELPTGNSEETDWLSLQFSSIPFLLFKYWLVLNFAATMIYEYFLVRALCASYADLASLAFDDHLIYAPLAVSFLFFLYGCIEMLFGINKRHSRIALQSVVKFQYNLVGSIMSLIYMICYHWENVSSVFIYGTLSGVLHFIGGLAVLRAFKQNHPLSRQSRIQGGSGDITQDILQQNEVIGAEVSKYDAQLSTWPYIFYRLWLKAVVIFEASFIPGYIIVKIMVVFTPINPNDKDINIIDLGPWIVLAILFSLNAYSCFKIEETIRTSNLTKSKRILLLLKICTVLSIITSGVVTIYVYFGKQFKVSSETFFYSFFKWLAYIVIPPVVTLIGAIKAERIIEERENFVKVSSYTQSSYL